MRDYYKELVRENLKRTDNPSLDGLSNSILIGCAMIAESLSDVSNAIEDLDFPDIEESIEKLGHIVRAGLLEAAEIHKKGLI